MFQFSLSQATSVCDVTTISSIALGALLRNCRGCRVAVALSTVAPRGYSSGLACTPLAPRVSLVSLDRPRKPVSAIAFRTPNHLFTPVPTRSYVFPCPRLTRRWTPRISVGILRYTLRRCTTRRRQYAFYWTQG